MELDIDLNILNLSIDFELAALNAFRSVFPEISITCCHFHFSQSIIRKLNELGLKSKSKSSEMLYQQIRQFIALPFCVSIEITNVYETLKSSVDTDLQEFVQYFEVCL